MTTKLEWAYLLQVADDAVYSAVGMQLPSVLKPCSTYHCESRQASVGIEKKRTGSRQTRLAREF